MTPMSRQGFPICYGLKCNEPDTGDIWLYSWIVISCPVYEDRHVAKSRLRFATYSINFLLRFKKLISSRGKKKQSETHCTYSRSGSRHLYIINKSKVSLRKIKVKNMAHVSMWQGLAGAEHTISTQSRPSCLPCPFPLLLSQPGSILFSDINSLTPV